MFCVCINMHVFKLFIIIHVCIHCGWVGKSIFLHAGNTCLSFLYMQNYKNSCVLAAQKISPDTKDKVQLQVVMHTGGANTFHFANPASRKSQLTDREGIKELLQQLLPRFKQQVDSELSEKQRYWKIFYIIVGLNCTMVSFSQSYDGLTLWTSNYFLPNSCRRQNTF